MNRGAWTILASLMVGLGIASGCTARDRGGPSVQPHQSASTLVHSGRPTTKLRWLYGSGKRDRDNARFYLDGEECGVGPAGFERVLEAVALLPSGSVIVVCPPYEGESSGSWDWRRGVPFDAGRLSEVARGHGIQIRAQSPIGGSDGGADDEGEQEEGNSGSGEERGAS